RPTMVTKDVHPSYDALKKATEVVRKEPNPGQSPIFEELEAVARLIDENHTVSWAIEKRLQPILESEHADSSDPSFPFDDTNDNNGELLLELRRHSLGLRKLLTRQQAFYNRIQLKTRLSEYK